MMRKDSKLTIPSHLDFHIDPFSFGLLRQGMSKMLPLNLFKSDGRPLCFGAYVESVVKSLPPQQMSPSTSSGREFLIFKLRPHPGNRFVPQSSVQLSCRITANSDSMLTAVCDYCRSTPTQLLSQRRPSALGRTCCAWCLTRAM